MDKVVKLLGKHKFIYAMCPIVGFGIGEFGKYCGWW